MNRTAVALLCLLQMSAVVAADDAPAAPPAPAGPENVQVTGIKAVYRHGQVFVTFKDAAEGEAGAQLRYALYRADQPITQDNLDKAELCYNGVLNNSAKLYGAAFNNETPQSKLGHLFGLSRLNPNTPVLTIWRDGKATPTTMPTFILEEGGTPLPMWSGVAVRTVERDGKGYYAVVATDLAGKPLSKVVPGQSATTEAVDEKVAPIQPIRIADSKTFGQYARQLAITGTKNLPLVVSVHASNSTGGLAGSHGDYYVYFGTPEMGYRDGLPGAFCVQESRPASGTKGDNTLVLGNRDTIESPTGRGAMETFWFGYYGTPQWAKDQTPRAYPVTENRVLWSIGWVMEHYGVDPKRVYGVGQSMGGWGSMTLLFRHPERFAALFPRLPRMRQRGLPALAKVGKVGKLDEVMMPDGKTPYVERMDMVRFAAEHHDDLPFLGWSIGRHDGFATWKEQVDMVRALTANHHGFALAWNNGGHGEGAAPMGKLAKYYRNDLFALDRSYPAFGNSSLDDDLGGGELAEVVVDGKKRMEPRDGAKEGGINLGFAWADVVDEPDGWSVKLSNDLCKDAPVTVDVTPRRCQRFKPKPGDKLKWTNSAGGEGEVVADQWGLLTVPKVAIQPGQPATLTIRR